MFRNSILGADGTLVRQQMQSEGFVTGVTGWLLERNGNAEFNNVLIRGDLSTGPPAPYVQILNGSATVDFYSANVFQTAPGHVGVDAVYPDAVTIEGPAISGNTPALISVGNGTPGSLTGGPTVFVDEFLSVDNQITAPGTPYSENADGTNRATTSTAFTGIAGSVNYTFAWPYSRRFLVLGWALINNSVAAQQGLMSFEVRDANIGGTLLYAASDIGAARSAGSANQSATAVHYVDLTAQPILSGTLFIRAMFRSTNAANTANFAQHQLTVIPVL